MRLISQNGSTDIDYRNYDLVISEDGYAIEAVNAYNPKHRIRMAEYPSANDVLKVMRTVQTHYRKWQEFGDNNSITMMKFVPPKVFVFPEQKAVRRYD